VAGIRAVQLTATPMKLPTRLLHSLLAIFFVATSGLAAAPIKVMLLTGESTRYHDWTKSSPLLKSYLEQTGLFAVDVVVAPAKDVATSDFKPKFSDYALIVLDYETSDWPEATKQAFVDYMKNGGGLVTVHAADNAFPRWVEFNEMIGVGGWGGRTQAAGPKIRWVEGKMVLDSASPGNASHPPPHDFAITARAPDHPVMKGLPTEWLHARDELYSHLRGPAKNVTVLATGRADKTRFPNGVDEPVLMAIDYGKGRVFHTTLGHVGPSSQPPFLSMTCVGFIVTLQRGAEWAATGKVTQAVPADFPTAENVSSRN
jgi:uncharacterized protein